MQTILDRLEPWAIFLSILGILFAPVGKPWCWAVLTVVCAVRVVRAWHDGWQYFSSETMSDVLSAVGFLVAVPLLYSWLHSAAPSFVHERPTTQGLQHGEWRVHIGQDPGRLLIRKNRRDWDVFVVAGKKPSRVASAKLHMSDLWSQSVIEYREGVKLRDVHIAGAAHCTGRIQLAPDGTPTGLRLESASGANVRSEVTKP